MEKCSVCSKNLNGCKEEVLFLNGENKTVCSECKRNWNNLVKMDIPIMEMERSVNYFYECLKTVSDPYVKGHLMNKLQEKTIQINNKKEESKPVTNSSNTEIPFSIDRCSRIDPVASELWSWSEKIEKLGMVIFWIIIVLGIVVAITNAITVEEITRGYYYTYTDTETTFSFAMLCTTLIDWAWYAFIEKAAYLVSALILRALGNIVQNTKVAANVALYNASKKENEE